MTKSEDLKYQLQTLASNEPNDIDYPEFEVAYEDESGNEGLATVCCIDVAERALDRINELERQAMVAKQVIKNLKPYDVEQRKMVKSYFLFCSNSK